jgi:hypothetical protein
MFKLASIMFIIIGATLAGISILVIVSVPSWSAQAARLIPYAAALGFLIALPVSFFVAKSLD